MQLDLLEAQIDQVDESLIEAIWQDLDGLVTRGEIQRVAREIAETFRGATITTFIPLFIRRRTRETLKSVILHKNQKGSST